MDKLKEIEIKVIIDKLEHLLQELVIQFDQIDIIVLKEHNFPWRAPLEKQFLIV